MSLSSRRKQAKPQRLPEDESNGMKGSTEEQLALFLSNTSPSSPPIDLSTKAKHESFNDPLHSVLQTFERENTTDLFQRMIAQLEQKSEEKDEDEECGRLDEEEGEEDTTPPLTDSRDGSTHYPFPCASQNCGKSFASLAALSWHVEDCHSEEECVIQCESCSARFPSRGQFSAHSCPSSIPSRPSSTPSQQHTSSSQHRSSVPLDIRKDYRVVINDGSDIKEEEEESRNEPTTLSSLLPPKPDISLLSQIFPQHQDANIPMDLSTSSPLSPNRLPMSSSFPFPSPFMRPPMTDLLSTPRVPVDNILANEDDWESLMEVSTTDEAEKIRALVGDKPVPTTDPNQCILCRRVLSCKSALQMHYRTHTGERPFKCKICQRAFTTKGNLKTHMGVHRSKHSFRPSNINSSLPSSSLPQQQCPICQKRLATVAQLQSHMSEHTQRLCIPEGVPQMPNLPPLPFLPFLSTPPNGQPPSSPFAPFMQQLLAAQQRLSASTPLQSEESSPSKESSVPPSMCLSFEKQTTSMEENREMKNEGVSLSPAGCSDDAHEQTDGSSVSHSSDSEEHKQQQAALIAEELVRPPTDESDKPSENPLDAMKKMWAETEPPPPRPMPTLSKHQCAVCYKHFSSSSALQIHMRTHTGDKPFKCEVCGRAFTTRGNLKVHMSTHMSMNCPSRRGRRIFDASLNMSPPSQLPLPAGLQMPPQLAAQLSAMGTNLLPSAPLPMQLLMQAMTSSLESAMKGSSCFLCQKTFSNGAELSEHIREHSVCLKGAMDVKTE